MARAKRASHRSGTERPRWVLGGLGETQETDWGSDDPAADDALGTDGDTGQPGPEGVPVNGHNGRAQNGAVQGGADGWGADRLGQVGQIGRPGQSGRAGQSGPPGQNRSDGQDGRNGLNGQVDMNAQPHDGHIPQQGEDQQGDKGTPSGKKPVGNKKTLPAKDPQAGEKPQDAEDPKTSGTTQSAGNSQSGQPSDAATSSKSDAGEVQTGQPSADRAEDWHTAENGQVPQDLSAQQGRAAADAHLRSGEFGTPIRVDEIAVAAIALSENLQAATKGLPESVESRQFRRDLDEAADTFRSVASELETTASNLIRMAAHDGESCGVTWGVCPEHGITLMNSGDVVTCHVLGCHREQEGLAEPCTQPVAYKVVDAAGPALFACAGHAIACRLHLEGAVITLASDSLELL
jgi:hypothetical protein